MIPQAADAIDRIEPTLRPLGRPIMKQSWRHLLFLHWPVPEEALRPLLPPGLTLDTFEGTAYVGLVPFTMRGVRPIPFPAFPPLSNFHETNVRTYVHYQGRNPGVWFFSLDAANATAVRIARAWYKLPYFYARMRLDPLYAYRDGRDLVTGKPTGGHKQNGFEYRSERLWPRPLPAALTLHYSPRGEVFHAAPGTLEHFLAERYILYAYANRRLYSGRVHHTPYPIQTARVHELNESLIAAAGIRRPDTPPLLVHYATGVDVDVFPLTPVAKD